MAGEWYKDYENMHVDSPKYDPLSADQFVSEVTEYGASESEASSYDFDYRHVEHTPTNFSVDICTSNVIIDSDSEYDPEVTQAIRKYIESIGITVREYPDHLEKVNHDHIHITPDKGVN